MKALWTALSVAALANLIALVALGAWLVKSDRLDNDRARRIRELLTITITDEKAASAAELASLEQKKAEEETARKENQAPLTAAEQLEARLEATELDRQRAERLKREVQDLRASLSSERAKLDSDWKQLRDAQKAHADQIQQNLATVGSEQFQKTLTVLSKLEPKEAKSVLMQMLDGAGIQPVQVPGISMAPVAAPPTANPQAPTTGPEPSTVSPSSPSSRPGTQQVLAYIDAMDDKIRTAILNEIIKEDPKLAAELLEALRVRGTFAAVAQGAP